MVVVTRTSASPVEEVLHHPSSARSGICPCARTKRTPGTSSRSLSATSSMLSTRLWTKKVCPPRATSRSMACLDEVLVVGADVREDAAPPGWRRLDHAYVAQGGEAHLHGAWDRGRRQREDVHGGLVLLDALLVPDAEALLLVHHDEPEVSWA